MYSFSCAISHVASCLQCPPSLKNFDPWDIEHLLCLLESWEPDSSLTTVKLAWKTATLLVLVTTKHCSDLTLLCIDNQRLFLFSNMLLFSFLYLVVRLIDWVIFLLRFKLSAILMLNFAFILFEGLFGA